MSDLKNEVHPENNLMREITRACLIMAEIHNHFDETVCYDLVSNDPNESERIIRRKRGQLYKKWMFECSQNFPKFFLTLTDENKNNFVRWANGKIDLEKVKKNQEQGIVPSFPVNKQVFLHPSKQKEVTDAENVMVEEAERQYEIIHSQRTGRPMNGHAIRDVNGSNIQEGRRNVPPSKAGMTMSKFMQMKEDSYKMFGITPVKKTS